MWLSAAGVLTSATIVSVLVYGFALRVGTGACAGSALFAFGVAAVSFCTGIFVVELGYLKFEAALDAKIFPPWQHGKNNDATSRGFEFTVPQVDDPADFHGDITDPKLVLYVGGNYFFAMAPLVAEFEKEHPDYKGRLYWETIPTSDK
jgi:hypothetical protein